MNAEQNARLDAAIDALAEQALARHAANPDEPTRGVRLLFSANTSPAPRRLRSITIGEGGPTLILTRRDQQAIVRAFNRRADRTGVAVMDGQPLIVNGRMVRAEDTEPIMVGSRVVAHRYTAPRQPPSGLRRGPSVGVTRAELIEVRERLGSEMTQQGLADELAKTDRTVPIDARTVRRWFRALAPMEIEGMTPWELFRDHGVIHQELLDRLD